MEEMGKTEVMGRTEDIHGNHTGYFYADLLDFSVRDLFAAFALAGLVSLEDPLEIDPTAKMSYKYADAMIAQRSEQKSLRN